jgi:hypothetical protein
MNLAVFAGLRRFMKGSQTVLWEKAKRSVVNEPETFAPPNERKN